VFTRASVFENQSFFTVDGHSISNPRFDTGETAIGVAVARNRISSLAVHATYTSLGFHPSRPLIDEP
jgi:hypothetical protein